MLCLKGEALVIEKCTIFTVIYQRRVEENDGVNVFVFLHQLKRAHVDGS